MAAFNVFLINPPYKKGAGFNREGRCTQESGFWATPWPPYSLASMAAGIRDGNILRILDCPAQKIDAAELERIIRRDRPDILIASVSTPTIDEDLAFLIRAKAIYTFKVVLIGIHATVFAEAILRDHAIDFIVCGEPEETVKELVLALRDGREVADIQGIVFRKDTGETVSTPHRPFIRDLDALPFPAWDLVDLNRYRLPVVNRKFVIVNSIRGCPFRCSFCNAQVYYGSKARARSIQNIIKEIKDAKEKYNITDFFFWGDTFTLMKDQVRELCHSLIDEKLDIRWVANSRVDTVDEEILMLMKRAGCWMISFGIESGNDEILKRCGKNITREKIFQAIAAARQARLMTAGHFILGLPGETKATAQETVVLARELKLDFSNIYAAVPFPGSALYDEAIRNGWIRASDWKQFNQAEFVMDIPTISKSALRGIRKKAQYAVYLRPKSLTTAISLIWARAARPKRSRTIHKDGRSSGNKDSKP